jgi:glutamate synthase (NADPH/NADH) small chain
MGKPTGFIEFDRAVPEKIPAAERLKNFHEFVGRFNETELNHQAARCMNCGVPFCHSHSGCPLGNIIPEFNDAVYRKNWKEAYEILNATNNFPEFTGRICPAPCESACVLGINEPPVTIEEIEKHIIEIAFEKGFVQPKKINVRSGKKVAVVGSGPAGLAAAAQLNNAGHLVTVFERDDAPGGLLRYGIPDFKLEKWVINRRIDILEKEGIIFKYNANVGVNIPVKDILENYDAVVIAGGSTVPRNLPVKGRELKGVHFAMEFLKQQNKFNAEKNPFANSEIESNIYPEIINAFGKNVVVIGGGDTGSDCIGTSRRQGAKTVTQLELLPQPPRSRTHHMPWPVYPMLLKTTSSHEEGADREWSVATKEFLQDEHGNLRALKLVNLEWKIAEDGRPSGFQEVAGTERELPCELVLLAMGFVHPQIEGMLTDMQILLDERNNIKADNISYQTNNKKIFAAGDIRRGQSLVVWAINEGRECAAQVDEFLKADNPTLV